jgi:hypothetical protein
MLHFIYSTPSGPSGPHNASELWQIIDISGYESDIGAGGVVAQASVRFNRVPGDEETDTSFGLWIGSYAGSPSSFPSQWLNTELAASSEVLFSDSDPGSWETVSRTLSLPPETDFLVIHIAAVENIFNEGAGEEFDGHYADDVRLNLCIPPQ